jgi:hypothetical protein
VFYSPKDFKYVLPFFSISEQLSFDHKHPGFISEYIQEGYRDDPRYIKRSRKGVNISVNGTSEASTTFTQEPLKSIQLKHILSETVENVDDIPDVTANLDRINADDTFLQNDENRHNPKVEQPITDSLMFPPNATDTSPAESNRTPDESNRTPAPKHYNMVETDQGSASPPILQDEDGPNKMKSHSSRHLLGVNGITSNPEKALGVDSTSFRK